MIKVVLDANQFVSALLKQASNSSLIIDLVHSEDVRLLVSEKIITEIDRVIRYPKVKKIHRRSDSNLDAFIIKIVRVAQMVPGTLKLRVIEEDPTDDKYLECAIEGGADFIISGDRHLKNLWSFREIPIVSPAEFLKRIKTLRLSALAEKNNG